MGDGSPVKMNIGDNVTAATNTTIIIRCRVSGVPTPSVFWSKDGLPISESGNLFTSGNTLVIERADAGDSAKYTCIGLSSIGADSVSSIVQIIG